MSFKRTKIVCTIGPASSSFETLAAMMRAGMNVARLNFSHGTHPAHAELIKAIRAAADATGEPVAILQDLQGPKIRVGLLPEAGFLLKKGAEIVLTAGEASADASRLPISYERLHADVRAGERVLFDDGLMSAKVLRVKGGDAVCEVVDGGLLTSHKGVNFPDSKLSVSPITEKDKSDLAFGAAQGVDFIALSFVRSARELVELRGLIASAEAALGNRSRAPIRVVAKIEKREAVERMEDIVAEADAVMVARGDLGVEMPVEQVPIVQKRLAAACLAAGKPVIVATQMLDSMIRNPRPTRAEVSDIANAVIDHADAVMLSGETADGAHPLEAVETMAKIAREIEASPLDDLDGEERRKRVRPDDAPGQAIAEALARHPEAKLAVVASPLGDLARAVSRLRPDMPIVAATDDPRTRRQLNLSWGVLPILQERVSDAETFLDRAAQALVALGMAASGETILLVGGDPVGPLHQRIEIRELP